MTQGQKNIPDYKPNIDFLEEGFIAIRYNIIDPNSAPTYPNFM